MVYYNNMNETRFGDLNTNGMLHITAESNVGAVGFSYLICERLFF